MVGLIAGIGFFVLNQKSTSSDDYSSAPTRKVPVDTDKKETPSQSVEKLIDTAAEEEIKLDDELADEADADALDDQSAAQSVGTGVEANVNF